MSGRTHSEESKIIMSDAKKGTTHSNETKTKISDAMIGSSHSDNTRKIISDTAKKISHPGRFKPGQQRPEGSGIPSQQIEVTDVTNNTTICYDSISEAARALNCNESSIRYILKSNSNKPYKGQYTFKKF